MKEIKVTEEEAMLVDWVLTMHQYDPVYLDFLLKPEIVAVRYQAGRAILDGGGSIGLSEEELDYFLIVVEITFKWDKDDVGYSLKKKLYTAQLGFDFSLLEREDG